MQDLHLVGFTKDHKHLIFSTRKGAKSGSYVIPVDDELVEAVTAVADRVESEPTSEPDPEPVTPKVESQLSVREVQARLRAGDDVTAVAADAGVEPEWVERFAAPIRAEQRRIVDRALIVPLTRARAGESAVPLRWAVAGAMAERGVEFSAEGFEAAWSAHLVGGDEWVVTFDFPSRGRKRRLKWNFDLGSSKLTTTDRFASQIAFVESADDLPPADTTVGARPTRTSSAVARGALTSGGLARPGSGRVTTPSGTASMTPTVRPAPSPPAPAPIRPTPAPTPAQDATPRAEVRMEPAPPRPTPPAEPPPRPAAPAARPARSMPERDRREVRPAPAPERTPERRPLPTAPRPTHRSPLPPRRPAPVAATTNATQGFSRRPAPAVAQRMPVTVDGADPRRGMDVGDRRALDEAVRSQPPGRGESVVVLRPVVDDVDDTAHDDVADTADDERGPDVDLAIDETGQFEAIDDAPAADANVDQRVEDEVDEQVDDEEFSDDELDAADIDDPGADWEIDDDADAATDTDVDVAEDDPAAPFSITLNVPAQRSEGEEDDDGEDFVPERAPVRLLPRVQVVTVDDTDPDDTDDDPDASPQVEFDEPEDVVDAEDDDEDWYDDEVDESEDDGWYDDEDGAEHGDDDDDDDVVELSPRRSTVQIRPGSVTRARRTVNGRRRPLQAGVDAAPLDGKAPEDDPVDADEPTRPAPSRRRRREPLRAR